MKASQLIEHLQKLIETHGDLECVVYVDGDYCYPEGFYPVIEAEPREVEQAYHRDSNSFRSDEFVEIGTHAAAKKSEWIIVRTDAEPEQVHVIQIRAAS